MEEEMTVKERFTRWWWRVGVWIVCIILLGLIYYTTKYSVAIAKILIDLF